MHDIRALANRWKSAVVARTDIADFTGGAIRPKTLANHDALGTGPSGRYKIGRAVVYPVEAVIAWLDERITTPTPQNTDAAQGPNPRRRHNKNGGSYVRDTTTPARQF